MRSKENVIHHLQAVTGNVHGDGDLILVIWCKIGAGHVLFFTLAQVSTQHTLAPSAPVLRSRVFDIAHILV